MDAKRLVIGTLVGDGRGPGSPCAMGAGVGDPLSGDSRDTSDWLDTIVLGW
jgi:hypothetical protein